MSVIKKLRLKGFKSFASPTEFEFGNGFNCVIGSNGSGKCVVGDTSIQLANGDLISIKELVEIIKNMNNKSIKTIKDKSRFRPKNSEVLRLRADNTKAKKLLEWEPKISLEEGLKITLEWISENKNLYKYNTYNI